MRSFAAEDSGYQENFESAIYADDFYDAASRVADGKVGSTKIAGMLYVGSGIPQEIASDFGRDIGIGEATDGDFNDATDVNGDPLYTTCTVDKLKISGLETSSWSSPDTVCLSAMVVYSTEFDEKSELKAVQKGVTKATRNLK